MFTENGSGGSRTGVLTTFEDDDGQNYNRSLAEVGLKVEKVCASIGRTAISIKASSGAKYPRLMESLIPEKLDVPHMSDFTSPFSPFFEICEVRTRRN